MTGHPSDAVSGNARPGTEPPLSLADRELIDRYLAGKLDPGAEQQVEARIVGDAAFRREFELTQQLRAGLGDLAAGGALNPDYAPARAPFWQRPVFGLAASVAAGVLGLTALALHEQVERGRTALAQAEHVLERQRPVAIRGLRVVNVARTRAAGDEPDVRIQQPRPGELLELRVDAGAEPVAVYRVTLARVAAGAASTAMLLDVPSVAATGDGEVVLSVHPALLTPGDYELALRVPGSASADAVMRYRLRVED